MTPHECDKDAVITAKDVQLAMAMEALAIAQREKDAHHTEVVAAKDALLQAKEEQLTVALREKEELCKEKEELRKEKEMALQSEQMMRQLVNSLMAAQVTKMNILAKLHAPEPPTKFFELELNKETGYWGSYFFGVEDDKREKIGWFLLLKPDDPPTLCLRNFNPKKIRVSALCEVLGKKVEIESELLKNQLNFQKVPLPMTRAEFQQMTLGLDKIKVRIAVMVHSSE